jgi:hypothetical protein
MIKVEDGGGGEVSDLWVVGDLRTLLFAGGQGLANSTFSHVGGLPDLFMEHDVGALQGQENQNLSKNCCLWKGKTDHNILRLGGFQCSLTFSTI